MHKHRTLVAVILAVLVPVVVWAGNLVLPFTFTSGTPIRASEMNANFAAIKQSVDDLDTRVAGSGAGLVRSGSRLRAITAESPDGMSVPISYQGYPLFWDAQLETFCFAYMDRRIQTCFPLGGAQILYTDSTCQVRVGVANGTPSGLDVTVLRPDGGFRYYASDSFADGGLQFYPLGVASLSPVPTFQKSRGCFSDGGCVDSCVSQSISIVAPLLTPPIQVSDLATVSWHIR